MQQFSSESFGKWVKGKTSATLGELGLSSFPKEFEVISARTGATRRFSEDSEVQVANEFFDGEATAYISSCGRARIQIWC